MTQPIKVIITGATGMVGEGVLFECLQNPAVSEVLLISRKHYELVHSKLREILLPNFFDLGEYADAINDYDACFYCAGISSVGMKEDVYRFITYDTTMAFAKALLSANPNIVFTYVSGSHTDTSEKGRMMWARVKGKTENDLSTLGFKAQYNFRPGGMLPFKGQQNWKTTYKIVVKIISLFAPKIVITMSELGRAMINAVQLGYPKNVLEISDIKILAKAGKKE